MPGSDINAARAGFVSIASDRRERLALWWHGRRDGKRGVRAYRTDAGEVLTPQIEALGRDHGEVAESERLRLTVDLNAMESRRVELVQHADELVAALAELDERYRSVAEPGPGSSRRTGEDHLDAVVIQRRRRREYERSLEALRTERAALRRELGAVRAELDAIPERRRLRIEEADRRVAQFGQFTRRRMATYWRSFLRARREHDVQGWHLFPDRVNDLERRP
jgi:hypothetical protein